MKTRTLLVYLLGLCVILTSGHAQSLKPAPLSEQSQACLECHVSVTPGLAADWQTSRHAVSSPAAALAKSAVERRISATSIPAALQSSVVGCYECHGLRTESHADRFDHFGYTINVVVSPADCATCHPDEVQQYTGSKKASAHDNLVKNPVYSALMETITRKMDYHGNRLMAGASSGNARSETCLACHGTTVGVAGMRTINTDVGEVEIPVLTNWPSMGVGRINPDGSQGACTACHPRHSFSIEIARKPETCGQCHLEPDVPAYNIYKESKHGNIYDAKKDRWTWDAVPWTLGKDFTSPTCATCHNGLITNPEGGVVAERTHDFGARLWVRLFGLIYSHPQPRSGRTYEIVNADKLPLPTTFTGTPATSFLIAPEEQAKRKGVMTAICRNCHSTDWTEKHFARLDTTLQETDAMTLTATQLLSEAWGKKMVDKTNPFDEALEQDWVRQWLFYANSVRPASAMSGPDYAAFKHGWWDLTHNLQKMQEMIHLKATR